MGRSPCCSKLGLNRGPWSPEEDFCLAKYIETHGEGCWRAVPKSAGLLRCGKSCRLRWVNYLRPSVRRGNISEDEENLIIKLHSLLGNRWSLIAGRIPGRTDNEIKNYWNTHLSKKLKKMGFDPKTHKSVNMTQKTYCEPRADLRNENRPSPSVFQSQGNSVSESLKETSEHQTDSTRISLTCNELLQDSRLTSKESCSVEINLSNTYKIHSSEMVICRPTSPTSDHAVYHRITDRDLSISVNSEHQGEAVQLRPVSEVISTTGDSFTSNCSSPSSVLYPAGFSRSISNCDSLSSLLTTTSTNCKDQLIISSEPTSALTIEYDKERSALDQTGFLQIFDFSSVDFTEYDTNAGSPARSD
ncbi:hypothetical protein O6H91_Y382200 [Diphasiastrum complanatum]|nr:hypothetical protein O6H91_Y382200 [Diphasiastrum complanatum]